MTTIQQAIEELQRYPADLPCAMVLWLPENVEEAYRQIREDGEQPETLTPAQQATVLHTIEVNHDRHEGITWETLWWAIREELAQ